MKALFKFSPTPQNILLVFILALSAFLRFFRINELLGFWYDQGRDALVIWDLIHKGKLFLIGPMMGFTGIFRGPWYYWLITPSYFLGGGNPLYPMYFLIFTSLAAIVVLYFLGKQIGGVKTGLIAAFLASSSFYVINASRWLSNPTPMLLISVVFFWSVLKVVEGKWKYLPFAFFLIALGLNFGSATEIFYLPALVISVFIAKKRLPKASIWFYSFLAFVSVFIPQALFEMRHPGVLSGALFEFLKGGGSGAFGGGSDFGERIIFFYRLFASKFWVDGYMAFLPFFVFFVLFVLFKWKGLVKDGKFKALLVFNFVPFLGMLFYRGTGEIYEYYFTGYYLIFILLVSFVLSKASEGALGKVVLALFLVVFSLQNLHSYKKSYLIDSNDPYLVSFENQLKAVDWIYEDASGEGFNVDAYTPPVIPYAYDYLFKWYPQREGLYVPDTNYTQVLYTLYEADFYHPERLEAWLKRQEGIGEIVRGETFGGITVQRRLRI